jgi:hypothetical protein
MQWNPKTGLAQYFISNQGFHTPELVKSLTFRSNVSWLCKSVGPVLPVSDLKAFFMRKGFFPGVICADISPGWEKAGKLCAYGLGKVFIVRITNTYSG